MSVLIPCPFCGCSDVKQYTKKMPDGMTMKYLACTRADCGAVVSFRGVPPTGAVEQWNKRTAFEIH